MESRFFNDLINDVSEGNMTEKEAVMLTIQMFCDADDMVEDHGAAEVRKIKKNCAEVWKALLPVCEGALKENVFEIFSRWLREGALHEMEEAAKVWMEFFEGDGFDQRKLQVVDEKIKMCSDKKELDRWIGRRIELAEKCGLSSEDTEAFEKKYWDRPLVRQSVIKRLTGEGEKEKALELLKESRKLDADDEALVEWYCREIIRISRRIGPDIYRKELYDVVTVYLPCDVLAFRFLKRSCSSEEWRKVREAVFEKAGHMPGAAELYVEEGMFNRLMEYLKEYGSLEDIIRYEKTLGQKYAVDILHAYEKVFDEMVSTALRRCHYRNIVKHIKRMERYPGGEKKMYDMIGRWREKYSRKTALLKELAKL